MKLFRSQENIPEIYVDKSRDFQLLCRLKDVVFGGVKYTIDSLNHISNTHEINATLLPLLKSKIGFFDSEDLSEDQLRYLLEGFPAIIKCKGSKKSIEYAVNLWLRVNKLSGKITTIIINNEEYSIDIHINTDPYNTKLLTQILNYIVPTGYIVRYMFSEDNIVSKDYNIIQSFKGINIHNKQNSVIRSGSDSEYPNNLIASVGFTRIITESEYYDDMIDPTISEISSEGDSLNA